VVIVSEYIFIPWKHAQERAARLAVDNAGGSISSTPSITVAGAATLEAEEVLFLRDKVIFNC
jgi:DNA polymerase epsilon subunit 1